MIRNLRARKIQPDWWRKTAAGIVFGFILALGLSGLFAWLGPGGISAPIKSQFIMWSIAPLWMIIFSVVYLIPTGNKALLWLGVASAIVHLILLMINL